MIKNRKFTATGQHKTGILPNQNFLLKRAEVLSAREKDNCVRTLYVLHNGNYAVHVIYDHPTKADEIIRIAKSDALEEFNVNL